MAKAKLTKNFPVFDCDAHIQNAPMQWQKYLTKAEEERVKPLMWNYGDHVWLGGGARPIKPGVEFAAGQPSGRGRSHINLITLSGVGLNSKKLKRKLYEMELSDTQVKYLEQQGAYDPIARLADMDMMGIDQVLVFPILGTDTPDSLAEDAINRAYNKWVKYDYCDAAPNRLFPTAFLPMSDPFLAAAELRRTAAEGFPVATIRPADIQGNYPNQPKFDILWRTFEETGLAWGMHTIVGGRVREGGLLSAPGTLVGNASPLNTPGHVVSNSQIQSSEQTIGFIMEGMTWVMNVALSGFMERYPKLRLAVFEANGSWLPFVLEACDRMAELYGSQRTAKLSMLPSEMFQQRCGIAFEGDEEWVFRRHDYFANTAVWSSDVYHHDGTDAWFAIENMERLEVPEATQAKLLGGNARRLYGLEDKAELFVTEQPDFSQIERPEWYPKLEDVEKEFANAGKARAGKANSRTSVSRDDEVSSGGY